jgi:hypothetical protein
MAELYVPFRHARLHTKFNRAVTNVPNRRLARRCANAPRIAARDNR